MKVRYSAIIPQFISVTFSQYPEIFQDPLKYEKKSVYFFIIPEILKYISRGLSWNISGIFVYVTMERCTH